MHLKSLEVYRTALDLVAAVDLIASTVGEGRKSVRDDLREAVLAVPTRIAAAAAEPETCDQRHGFAVARGAVAACVALVDLCRILAVGEQQAVERAEELLERLDGLLLRQAGPYYTRNPVEPEPA